MANFQLTTAVSSEPTYQIRPTSPNRAIGDYSEGTRPTRIMTVEGRNQPTLSPISTTRESSKPLKGCLKKVSSFPDVADLVEEEPSFTKRSGRLHNSASCINGSVKSYKSDSAERREKRRLRKLKSADQDVYPPVKPRCTARTPDRSRSCEDIIHPPSRHQRPVKGILKKSTSVDLPVIRKKVSWSSDLNRWNSHGSGLNLKALVANKSEGSAALKINHKWNEPSALSAPSKSTTSQVLSELLKKHQAPGKPQRRQSVDSNKTSTGIGTGTGTGINPFANTVNDFQVDYSTLVRAMMSGPKRPVRQTSAEIKPENDDI